MTTQHIASLLTFGNPILKFAGDHEVPVKQRGYFVSSNRLAKFCLINECLVTPTIDDSTAPRGSSSSIGAKANTLKERCSRVAELKRR